MHVHRSDYRAIFCGKKFILSQSCGNIVVFFLRNENQSCDALAKLDVDHDSHYGISYCWCALREICLTVTRADNYCSVGQVGNGNFAMASQSDRLVK